MLISHELINRVEDNEGYREFMYKCPGDKWTIGFGLNLEAGLPKDEAREILKMRLEKLQAQIRMKMPFVYDIPIKIEEVLVEIAYQLGFDGLRKFKKALAALEAKDYNKAADEFLDSRWHKQTPQRCEELAEIVRSFA